MIYEYISSYCDKKKITIPELERRVGLGRGTISKWKDGTSQPSLPKLQVLSGEMGVSLSTLVKEWEKEK